MKTGKTTEFGISYAQSCLKPLIFKNKQAIGLKTVDGKQMVSVTTGWKMLLSNMMFLLGK